MRLKDKVAIITGGGSGIGKALALGLAGEGADIVITDINETGLQKAEEEIRAAGSDVLGLKSDISKMGDVQDTVDQALKKFGKIDILVNNAGIYPIGPFLEKDESLFDKVVDVNFKGLFFLTQAAARHMVKRKYGKIINICSSHARIGIPMNSEYAGTKGAVLALTRSLAAELSPEGVNVNSIACGLTDTEGVRALNYPKEMLDVVIGATPMRRVGKAEDYVGIAIFLGSDESSFVTGQTISVDGGLSMP